MAGAEDPCQYVSVPYVAGLYRVSPNTIYRRIRDGSIPSVRIGRLLRIPTSYLDSLPTGEVPEAVEAAAERLAASAPPLTPEQQDLIGVAMAPAIRAVTPDVGHLKRG